ncbi:Thioredoxin-like 3-2, chloroplastic [Zostera marina]|uniref:Thioredoxin-like 3-2, chloroplastic n=1 Tax=Zostera marina TaxID=29655 RepID=A0A0K9P4R6_ZOSMR|nr:Thioredoxin-like 3-2, chloroplastic [Zostera marina]
MIGRDVFRLPQPLSICMDNNRQSSLLPISISSSSFHAVILPPCLLRRSNLICKAASLSAFDRDGEKPSSMELEAISGEEEFDQIIEGKQTEKLIVVLWMAEWCRKCIYLKPKLKKLAASLYSRTRFYYIDVNSVPQRLVNRAEVTKMPTIQVWKNSKKQGEVFGGHKAWVVVHEVEEMIENQ